MQDPKNKYDRPPFPPQAQEDFPGIESKMEPAPDYGKGKYKGSGKLKGKVALITGGDSGIGRATAYAFAQEGADVAIAYLSEDGDATKIEKDIKELGKKCLLIEGDIKSEENCQKAVDTTVKKLGGLDILVNNAAYQFEVNSINEITKDELEKIFQTNVFAIFYLSKAAIKHMKPGSTIINTSSVQAYSPAARLIAYAATKGAVSNFTKGFALEAIKNGIRVNAVAPGPVWTPFIPASSKPQSVSKFGSDSLLKKAGTTGRTCADICISRIR